MTDKIEHYAMIGDCESAALVSSSGSIDWLCWPAFDSDACFAALLGGEQNGHWRIRPASPILRVNRRYRGDTLILETTFETAEGVVQLIDFMPVNSGAPTICRMVRGMSGAVEMRMDLALRFGFGLNVPWMQRTGTREITAICGPDLVVLRSDVETRGEGLSTVADFNIAEGDTALFLLSYGASHLPTPPVVDAASLFETTHTFWSEWAARCTYDGLCRDKVLRSLLTLKALTFSRSGGVVAAPTTSLPEKIGGARNWDYRFCWLRDASFTLGALLFSGYTQEALDWHGWLLRAVAGTPADMQIMYGIRGERRLLEWQADWLPGYEGSRPVRVGNAAHGQIQLDVYGELLAALHLARVAKLELSEESWSMECKVLAHVAKVWRDVDNGIWERRGEGRHYVFSKVMCWLAFDRGIQSAEEFGFEAPLDEWYAVRAEIHADVCARGFSEKHNAFMESYGSEVLDASNLLLFSIGFLPADDPRMVATLAATERYLLRDGLVLRHDPREISGIEDQPIEGAFLACSMWLADAYVQSDKIEQAEAMLEHILSLANDVGLLAEEYDQVEQRQLGNFPQALTHLAIVFTAHNIARARKHGVAGLPR